jgi:hypothetical protein
MRYDKRTKWIAAALVLAVAGGFLGFKAAGAAESSAPPPAGPLRRAYWRALGIKTSRLRLSTLDAHTQQPIPGAGCVVTETGDRVETGPNGVAPEIEAPVFRHPRLERQLAELHGQLNVICYKNGYRDAIYMGVRMHENSVTEPQVWMTRIGVGDRRIEPTLYQMPMHRIWLVQLADKFRLRDQGEGRESPALTRPNQPPAPQEDMGKGIQPPPLRGPSTELLEPPVR